METRKRTVPFKCLTVTFALLLVLAIVGSSVVWADSGADTFTIVSGLNVSRASSNDDTITLRVTGTLSIHPKSITATGTFVHKNASGATLATGKLTALSLLSFDDFGSLPPPNAALHGGRALALVHLTPSGGGAGHDAVLEIICAIDANPAFDEDGMRLAVQDGINFNKIERGMTVFIDAT